MLWKTDCSSTTLSIVTVATVLILYRLFSVAIPNERTDGHAALNANQPDFITLAESNN